MVKKAVIPAGGMGTRLLPATKAQPKEMLPVLDRPVIHYVVEEAVRSGIEDILIITSSGKSAIFDYFDSSYWLEHCLEKSGKHEALKRMREISDMADIYFIRQREPKGLGDAISYAEKHVNGEPFAVLLGDDIIVNGKPALQQMVKVHEEFDAPVIAVKEIPKEKVPEYGIVDADFQGEYGKINDLIEKPSIAQAPSNLGIVGRYILTPEIFDYIRETPPGAKNEIQVTDAIRMYDRPVYACKLKGHRFDVGDRFGLVRANIELALRDEELKKKLEEYKRVYDGE